MRRPAAISLCFAAVLAALPAAAQKGPIELHVAQVGIPYGSDEPVARALSVQFRNAGRTQFEQLTLSIRLWGHGADWFDRYGANDCKGSTTLCAMTCDVALVGDRSGTGWKWPEIVPAGPMAAEVSKFSPGDLFAFLIFTGGADVRAEVEVAAAQTGSLLSERVEIRPYDTRRKITEIDYVELAKRCAASDK